MGHICFCVSLISLSNVFSRIFTVTVVGRISYLIYYMEVIEYLIYQYIYVCMSVCVCIHLFTGKWVLKLSISLVVEIILRRTCASMPFQDADFIWGYEP